MLTTALFGVAVVGAGTAQDRVVRVAGTTPPWSDADVRFVQTDAGAALRELYAGRADVALVSRSVGSPPPGVGRVTWIPVGLYEARVTYRLPGVALRLDVPTLCRMLAGEVTSWDDEALAALNPDERLPKLPVLSVARTVPNGASWVVANACVRGGHWPSAWRKASWSGGAVMPLGKLAEFLAALGTTGSLGVIAVKERVPGAGVARLLVSAGAETGPQAGPPEAVEPGGTLPPTLGPPARPDGSWPELASSGAYPLTGVVWAAVMREQRYRGRTPEDARALLSVLEALRSDGSGDVRAVPEAWRTAPDVVFGGRPLVRR